MIFHRLRMLSFSKSVLSIKSLGKTKSDVKEPIRCEGAPDVVELSMPLDVFQAAPNTKAPKENTKNSCSDRMPVNPRLEFKSKSANFKISLRKLRKGTNRRSLSLNDFKRRLSLKDLNLNRIKQKFQSFKEENIGKTNKNIAMKHELKVLYIAESSQRNRKRHSHHRKLNMRQSSRDLFGFYRHNRSFDPHTFYHRHNKENNPFNKLRARCARKKMKICEALNNYCPYTHHPFKVVTSDSNILSETTCCTNPLHYNLLKFPKNSKTKLSRNHSVRHQCCRKSVHDKLQKRSTNLKVPVLCVDKAVSAGGSEKRSSEQKTPANGSKTCPSKTCPRKTCPSKTCPRKTCPSKTCPSKTTPSKTCPSKTTPSKTCPSKTCPSKTCPSKTCLSKTTSSKTCPSKTCPSKTCPSLRDVRSLKQCNRRCKSKHSMRKFTFLQLYHKIHTMLSKYSTAAHSKYRIQNSSTRYCLRLVFLSLIVIAWSPCIIGIAIGWLLSSPLRPQHVMNAENEKTHESIDDCFCHFDWWTKYIDSVGSLSKASKNVFFNLFRRRKDTGCKRENLPRCRSHPDPRTRYSLYHADGRGWVMKPERPSAHVPSKQNIFKRAFKNMFCDCDCSSQNYSNKRVKNKTDGSANLNESISPDKRNVSTSLRATGNPTINVCGYKNKQFINNKHRKCFIPPKIHISEDDQFLPCLGCVTRQKSQSIFTHECGQSKEVVTFSEAVDKETQFDGAKRCSDIDHLLTECPTAQKPEDEIVCFRKPTKSSESHIHRSSILNCDNAERINSKSFFDKLISNIKCRLDFIGLSRQNLEEDASIPRTCDKSVCQVNLPEDTSKPRVCRKSVCTHLSKETSTTRGKSVHLPQGFFEPQVRSEPERKTHLPEETSNIRICRKSTCTKFQLPEYKNQEEMQQTLKSQYTQPDLELLQPAPQTAPVHGRSALKSSSRRSIKPDRITIADPPRRSRESHKILYLKIDNTKTTQTQEDGLEEPGTTMPQRKLKGEKQLQHVGPPKKKKLPFCQRVWCGFRRLGRRTADSVDRFDEELHDAIFPVEVGCADQYLNTLHSRPCFWVYDCWPRKYPAFLRGYYATKSCCYFCLISFSICFWAPFALWCYICYRLCSVICC